MNKKYFIDSKNYFELELIDEKKRGIIIIAPGGGYSHTSIREGLPVAKAFQKLGYHTAIIYYREEKNLFPKPQLEVAELVLYLKGLAQVDEKKIIGCGFSAGGHLILSAQFLEYTSFSGLITGYPVVSSDVAIAHMGSFDALLGSNAMDQDMRDLVSIEQQVNSSPPDLFLWTTQTDQAVPMENSLRLLEAYQKVGGNCEFHLYPMGQHGLSLATEETSGGDSSKVIAHVQGWFELVARWLKLKY